MSTEIWSNTRPCHPLLLFPEPGAVSDLTAVALSEHSIVIWWSAPEEPNGDILQYNYTLSAAATSGMDLVGNATQSYFVRVESLCKQL